MERSNTREHFKKATTENLKSNSMSNVGSNKKTRYELDEPIWDPFGSPGNGAPLRNQNNALVTKLPNVNKNIWERFVPAQAVVNNVLKNKENQMDKPNFEAKKNEIFNIIDSAPTIRNEDVGLSGRKSTQQLNYSLSTKKSETYWNDWFGRPGNGAPRWQLNKQNLDQLLEPKNPLFQTPRHRNFNSSIDTYTSYNPSVNTSMTSPRRFRSDHHNRYELNPR